MAAFRIDFPASLEKEPTYSFYNKADKDISNLEHAISEFREMHWPIKNEWHITVGEIAYSLHTDDIPYIWYFIPLHLKAINSGESDALDVLNQTHDMLIKAEHCSKDYVMISLVSHDVHYEPIKIPRRDYIGEWWTFVEQVIAFLVNDGLIDADDPSLEAYLKQMPPKPAPP